VRSRIAAAVVGASLCGCVYLTPFEDAKVTHAEPPQPDTRIALLLARAPDDNARALLVEDPHLALTSRIDLIDAADHSIDVQYYIWHNDATGILVIDKLLAAADRGVRVRALVDDIHLAGLVDRLTAFNGHPNIEVRIFNPFSVRLRFQLGLFRLLEFAIDGNRLNHRMHNKLLVADNQLAILGGRNIGDEYFGRGDDLNFFDTDVLLFGEVVPELSRGFDDYWNSRWAYPVEALVNFSLATADLDSVRNRIRKRLAKHPDLEQLSREVAFDDTVAKLLDGPTLAWHTTVVDDPNVSWGDRPDEIAAQLTEIALKAEREVLVASPYLVPTENLLGIAKTLIDRGVKITVLTNSLASNDLVVANTGYARFREQIVDAGINLYEFRADAPASRTLAPHSAEKESFHSKYIIFDDDLVFIGSLNLDPRSLYLNTELGVVLESPSLATALRNSFETLIDPENAWRVLNTPDGLR
jgi:putative cardiolipin synthase